MFILYFIGIRLYVGLLWVASFFHSKARLWVRGRQNWRTSLAQQCRPNGRPVCWIHVSSLGEFEQGRPLLEAIRAKKPDYYIVLSFFSPSGYELRKHYAQADCVCYLPVDTARNARAFIERIQPDLAIFVKYDFWYFFLQTLKKRGTTTLLISAVFREKQIFFQRYGGFWRSMLACFSHMYVQDEASVKRLATIGFKNVSKAGDTRIDRVLEIAATSVPVPLVEQWAKHTQRAWCIAAGSVWPADIEILSEFAQDQADTKWILAPHDPSESRVHHLLQIWKEPTVCYSELEAHLQASEPTETLVIDNVGMLNRLYRHAQLAYIGGGFNAGIHNTLEPAAYAIPVIFGPKYQKFTEAKDMIALGAAFSVKNATDLKRVVEHLREPERYAAAVAAVRAYLIQNKGATQRIMADLWP